MEKDKEYLRGRSNGFFSGVAIAILPIGILVSTLHWLNESKKKNEIEELKRDYRTEFSRSIDFSQPVIRAQHNGLDFLVLKTMMGEEIILIGKGDRYFSSKQLEVEQIEQKYKQEREQIEQTYQQKIQGIKNYLTSKPTTLLMRK